MKVQHRLLTPSERTTCQQISSRSDIYGQRARGLLALDDGHTQMEAGKQAALTIGQIKYAITKFRKQRLSVFPEALVLPPEEAVAIVLPPTVTNISTDVKPEKKKKGKKEKDVPKKGKKKSGKKAKKSLAAGKTKTKKDKTSKKAEKKLKVEKSKKKKDKPNKKDWKKTKKKKKKKNESVDVEQRRKEK